MYEVLEPLLKLQQISVKPFNIEKDVVAVKVYTLNDIFSVTQGSNVAVSETKNRECSKIINDFLKANVDTILLGQQIFRDALVILSKQHPSLFSFFLKFKVKLDTTIPTLGVRFEPEDNKYYFYYNPKFLVYFLARAIMYAGKIDSKSVYSIVFLLLHEIFHIIKAHTIITKEEEREHHEFYNIVMDSQINTQLKKMLGDKVPLNIFREGIGEGYNFYIKSTMKLLTEYSENISMDAVGRYIAKQILRLINFFNRTDVTVEKLEYVYIDFSKLRKVYAISEIVAALADLEKNGCTAPISRCVLELPDIIQEALRKRNKNAPLKKDKGKKQDLIGKYVVVYDKEIQVDGEYTEYFGKVLVDTPNLQLAGLDKPLRYSQIDRINIIPERGFKKGDVVTADIRDPKNLSVIIRSFTMEDLSNERIHPIELPVYLNPYFFPKKKSYLPLIDIKLVQKVEFLSQIPLGTKIRCKKSLVSGKLESIKESKASFVVVDGKGVTLDIFSPYAVVSAKGFREGEVVSVKSTKNLGVIVEVIEKEDGTYYKVKEVTPEQAKSLLGLMDVADTMGELETGDIRIYPENALIAVSNSNNVNVDSPAFEVETSESIDLGEGEEGEGEEGEGEEGEGEEGEGEEGEGEEGEGEEGEGEVRKEKDKTSGELEEDSLKSKDQSEEASQKAKEQTNQKEQGRFDISSKEEEEAIDDLLENCFGEEKAEVQKNQEELDINQIDYENNKRKAEGEAPESELSTNSKVQVDVPPNVLSEFSGNQKIFKIQNWEVVIKEKIQDVTGINIIYNDSSFNRRIIGAYGAEEDIPVIDNIVCMFDTSGSMGFNSYKKSLEILGDILSTSSVFKKSTVWVCKYASEMYYISKIRKFSKQKFRAKVKEGWESGGTAFIQSFIAMTKKVKPKPDVIFHFTDGQWVWHGYEKVQLLLKRTIHIIVDTSSLTKVTSFKEAPNRKFAKNHVIGRKR